MSLKYSIVLCLLAITSCYALDYCDSVKMECSRGTKHTQCDNPLSNGAWGKTCKEPKLIPMTGRLIRKLEDVHNERRNKIASGQENNYPPCARMATMEWDDELAEIAETWARGCVFDHDKCRNTERFTKAGQNAAIHITNAPNEPSIEETEDVVIKLAGSWYDKEIINGVHYGWAELIKKLPSGEFMRKQGPTKKIGHFTQMVGGDVFRFGCGGTRFRHGGSNRATLFVCNYSRTNMSLEPVYPIGAAGSKCNKRNPKYKSLCARSEKFTASYYAY